MTKKDEALEQRLRAIEFALLGLAQTIGLTDPEFAQAVGNNAIGQKRRSGLKLEGAAAEFFAAWGKALNEGSP